MINEVDIAMDEMEMQRLANIQRAGELNGDPGPGSFYCHEALHMASYLTQAIDSELSNHPAICANPEWFRLSVEAQDKLAELYQAIGRVHGSAGTRNE